MKSETRRSVQDDGAGFIMVVLLIGMAVGAIWMAALLPAWRTQVIREQEAELVFRGESIARAIYLYRQKNGQALPPSLDVLVSGKYLRKKYRDPIADKDFMVVGGATAAPGGTGGLVLPSQGGQAGGQLTGGIIGVRSTSNEQSFRVYNNQQTYSQWAFDFTLEQLRAGAGVPGGGLGTPQGGARGGRGQGGDGPPVPGGRGAIGPGPGGRGGPGPGPGGGLGTPGGVRPPGGSGNPGGGVPGGGGRRGGA